MIRPSQDAGGLRGQASPGHPPNSSRPGPSTAPGWTAAQGGGGTRRLNHLSLCSPQLNGSGQLKMSSHCLSAQMLAPPPPGLPRLALPPATKPTSEGGSSSPTSPCKHPGRRPPGAPSPPWPCCWGWGLRPTRCVPASLVGPQTEAWSTQGQGSLRRWPGASLGSASIGRVAWGPPCATPPRLPYPGSKPSSVQQAVGEDLKLEAGGPDPAPRCLLSVKKGTLL